MYFKAPKSYTGEDMVELQVHGGKSVINACFEAITDINPEYFRIAERGEFSKRAFSNDKMDLTEIEGVDDLINAETEFQRMQAFQLMSGRLTTLYESWRSNVIRSSAQIEGISCNYVLKHPADARNSFD